MGVSAYQKQTVCGQRGIRGIPKASFGAGRRGLAGTQQRVVRHGHGRRHSPTPPSSGSKRVLPQHGVDGPAAQVGG